MLRNLRRVFVAFSPGDPKAASAREFLQRVSGDKAKKSNPACKVEFKIDEEAPAGKSYIELQFNDNEQQKVFTADFRVQDLSRLIEQKGGEMEMRGVMKEVGYDPWNPKNRIDLVGAPGKAGQ